MGFRPLNLVRPFLSVLPTVAQAERCGSVRSKSSGHANVRFLGPNLGLFLLFLQAC